MQAINLMISEDSKVYFSIGMDRKIISAGLAAKHEKVIDYLGIEGLEYGYDFIEKFIQLPFKVPSPKSVDFLKFLVSANETGNSLGISEPISEYSIFEDFTSDKLPEEDIGSFPNENSRQEIGTDTSNNVEIKSNYPKILNDMDCIEDFETSKMILEMVSPALDNNPRRIKQFINQFRFQRTIGKRTGLFCYDEDTNFENMWNCRKLAKFVAININWNSLISALNSNKALLTLLQEYALNSENEDKNLEKWTRDERLIRLLRYGCIEEDNLSQTVDDYTLSGLDFSKLLQISPIVLYLEDENVLSPLPEAIGFMGFFLIPEGEFMMGSPQDELGRSSEEGPVHKVTIKNSFYLSKYPVTQKHWKKSYGE